MKPNIHPDYHEITVRMTDGTEYKTRSTYGKEGDVLQLDVDPKTHPAWTGGTGVVNKKAGKVARFEGKYGNFSFGKKSADSENADSEKK